MRAVWSLWTKPLRSERWNPWLSERHHLLSWILSFFTAREHYSDTVLYIDDQGADLLCRRLKLPFAEVDLSLDELASEDDHWWAMGKLYAYQLQSMPFLHLDSDVYLWNRLPDELISAPLFGQNPEWFADGSSWYRPHEFETMINRESGWLPPEWRWYTSRRGREAICCGIFGGHYLKFIRHFGRSALRIIRSSSDFREPDFVSSRKYNNILVEQYFLAACVAYHSTVPEAEFGPIVTRYLFDSEEAAYEGSEARRYGYTHLIAGSKRSPAFMERLETRVRRDYPDFYARACTIT